MVESASQKSVRLESGGVSNGGVSIAEVSKARIRWS